MGGLRTVWTMYGMRWKPQWMDSLPRMETFCMSTMVG
jgi:hypothetical protein